MDADIRQALEEKGEIAVDDILGEMYRNDPGPDFELAFRRALKHAYWKGAQSMVQEMFEDLQGRPLVH